MFPRHVPWVDSRYSRLVGYGFLPVWCAISFLSKNPEKNREDGCIFRVCGVDTVWTTWEIPMASWTVTSPLEKTRVTRKGVKNFQLEGLEDLVCWYVLCIFLSFKKGWIFQKLRISPFVFFSPFSAWFLSFSSKVAATSITVRALKGWTQI